MALAGEMTLLVPLADLIDLDEEQTRLKKEINKLLNDKQGITGKLKNKNFTDRAPADVVNKEKEKLSEVENSLNKLQKQLERINNLQ